jgi:hypothetical protein
MQNNQNKTTVINQLSFEFMLNALRLKAGFESDLFHKITKSAKLVILLIIPTYAKVSSQKNNL